MAFYPYQIFQCSGDFDLNSKGRIFHGRIESLSDSRPKCNEKAFGEVNPLGVSESSHKKIKDP